MATAARRGGRPTIEAAAALDESVREAALAIFLTNGYEATSMEAVAVAAGTTKASLYARYSSKDELFTSVLNWAAVRTDWPIAEPTPPPFDDLEAALVMVAETSLRRVLHPSMVQLSRIAISQAARFPELARTTLRIGSWQRQEFVADLLRFHAERGDILADEPEILAELFLAMVSGMPARLASMGVVREAAEQRRRTENCYAAFSAQSSSLAGRRYI